jgi:tetratricopeptide (TPR) repeat protein
LKTNSNISQEQLEAIERYINGTMVDDELKVFETQLETNSEFKTQVEDVRTLLTGIQAQSLKEQLDDFHKDIQKQPIQKASPKVRYLQFRKLVAAAAIIIAVGSFWFFNQNSNDKLYAKYFTPDPGLPTTMSSNSNYEFYEAMVSYKQGDFKTAIKKWKAINTKNDTLNYFLGVAYLADKDEVKAIEFLNEATRNDKFPLLDDAYFYLGLAHLKEGNIEKAKANLEHSNVDNSKAILSELNQ